MLMSLRVTLCSPSTTKTVVYCSLFLSLPLSLARSLAGRSSRRLLDISEDITTPEGVLHPDYNCDGTHMCVSDPRLTPLFDPDPIVRSTSPTGVEKH